MHEGTLPGTYPGAAGRAGAVLGASSAPVRVRDHKRATRLVALRATAGQGSDAQARRWHTRSACKARALLRLRLAVRCLHARLLRDLSRIAHVHARNPNDSRRRPSTPMACICYNEPKRFLSGGSCLHHTAMTYSFVTQPASSTSYADYTRRRTYRRSRVAMSCAAGSQRFRNASSFSRAGIPHAGKLRAEIWHAKRL